MTRISKEFFSEKHAKSKEIKLVFLIILVSVVIFIIILPLAKIQLPKIAAFIPFYESALIINDFITAVLLFGKFRFLRSASLFILSCGYLFTSCTEFIHILTFPEIFSKSGLIGAGPQTAAWLYNFWHGTFPLFIIAYTFIKKFNERKLIKYYMNKNIFILFGILFVLLLVFTFTIISTLGNNILPVIIINDFYTSSMIFVVASVWSISLIALIYLIVKRPYTILDMWLIVTMVTWLIDIALSAVFNNARYDVGFYAGRIFGLLSASFLLTILLFESSMLYSKLSRAYKNEHREKMRVLEKSNKLNILNKELDSFSYSISHDLRAPLRAIDGFVGILEENHSDQLDNEGKKMLQTVRKNSDFMKILIEDLLKFSKLGKQKLTTQKTNIDIIIKNIIDDFKLYCVDRNIQYQIQELGFMEADPTLIKQVFFNLISNAIKFTKNKDPAFIEIGYQFDEMNKDSKIYFVKDNGAGFDMKYADKLFGVFQRLHTKEEFEGTGVGLSIVKRIIERHGGQIWVNSILNGGTTFFFTIGKMPQKIKKYIQITD